MFVTLNKLNNALFSRQQSERFVEASNTTSDNDVEGYKWLLIDIDPERPSGVSSSDEELRNTFQTAKRIVTYLSESGFEEPVKAISGNGSPLLYRISLKNDAKAKTLIETFLKTIALLFDSEDTNVKVDTVNYNASRVCKLYGVCAQKGSNTKERPHRMSSIIGDVKDARITDVELIKKVCSLLPFESVPQPASKYNGYNEHSFDLEEWLSKYGLRHHGPKTFKGGTKYVLDQCPFDSSHRAPDSMVFRLESGAVGFKCLHNSCSGKRWQDLRLMFGPDAY